MVRRRWATKRKGLPRKDVAAAGGWKGTQLLSLVFLDRIVAGIKLVLEAEGLRF